MNHNLTPDTSYEAPSQSSQNYNAPAPASPTYSAPSQTYAEPEEQTYSPPAPAPSYNAPSETAKPSYSPPASNYGSPEKETSEAQFEYETEQPSYNNEAPSNVPKRQASGFHIGNPPVYTNAIGTPDIWSMFNEEWGQRSTRRRGRW